MKAVTNIYFQSSRCSGRTNSMIENLKNGDRVLFTNNAEAKRVHRLAKDRGLDIDCIVSPIEKNPLENGTSQCMSVLDHSWVEDYYRDALLRADKDIEFFNKQLSGYGEEHEQTKRTAQEIAKWQV